MNNNKIFVCTMKKTSVNYRMVLTLLPCVFSYAPFQNLEQIFMPIFVFSPFQSSSPMITSQTTSMVKRRGRYSFNTHSTILKSSSRGRRLGGQSSAATGLKLQGHSTVFQMRLICLYTIYDATFQRFQMLLVKLHAVV